MLAAQEAAALYQTDFVRNARAVGALWAGCSLCFGILEVVVLIQPAWVQTAPLTYQLPVSGALSDPSVSAVGSFGLYQVCTEQDGVLQCEGSLVTLTPIPSFKAAAVFVLMALVLVMGSVASLGLFWVCSAGTVYKVCAWQQLSAATCQALGCLVFPDGWGAPEVRALCGPQARSYTLGTCSIHWAFTLALLGIADALVLATLAFVLGNRQDALLPAGYTPPREGRGVTSALAPD
ncbi:LHFPL tetraspan subfamily member 5 protein-like [Candoia aspera]|uniref:LHFPL tetraspan subfamily member 5 protein-like n=1 Tax=Candoia aspera TaxID=51853 RepID=UPI002FD844DD